ncbi:hypothetical protein KC926_02370 [Candidatus Kaiserbacteria bacterium]|nr:hypothetical protein [Candidatus Kaiserbacteria bacterium]
MCASKSAELAVSDFPISFSKTELDRLGQKNRLSKKELAVLRRMMGKKVVRIILRVYHNVAEADIAEAMKDVEVVRVTLRENTPKYWGRIVEIIYRFQGKAGNYRYVFHFVSDTGGLNGRLYTQTKNFTPK